MHYVGADLHKETTWFYTTNEKGNKIDSKSISNKPEDLKGYFKTIPQPFILAVEATYNWYFFIDIAEQYAQEVYLANSYELKAYAKRHKKTDKIDAKLIANILRQGYLPTVTIPDKETRQIRELLRCRLSLVSDRCRDIFRLKALLDKLGLDSTGDFTTYKRLKGIKEYILPPIYSQIVEKHISNIEHLTQILYDSKKEIKTVSEQDEDIRNLMTIVGLSHFSASLIKTEIINVDRFLSFNRLCAYAGLAPRVSCSANTRHYGPLNNNRRKNLQWILIETVYHYIKGIPEKLKRYEEIKKRKGSNTAKIVLARDLLKVIYHILKEKRPFYFNKDSVKDYKIQSVAATALCGV